MTESEVVLLVGGGGREHAIARAFATGDHREREGEWPTERVLYACAGNRNPAIADVAAGFETIDGTDVEGVVDYAEAVGATLAIVGPEAPLEAGLVDALEEAGVYAFGPRKADARIETDKAFQREFMREAGVPGCPEFETFADSESAAAYVEAHDGDVAVKPTGLTGGKGVRVTGDQVTKAEAADYVRDSEYDDWVVEERLVGEEFTVQAFVANGDLRVTPAVQDHKRAYEGDEGPNTGGMGSYSDAALELPFMTQAEYREAVSVLETTVEALPEYRGVLYGQFMLTADGVKVVEFNARFGDPEAMNTLPVMETDLLSVLVAARDGHPLPELSFARRATVCKYGVPEGYPTDPKAGTKLTIDDATIERVNARLRDEAGGTAAADGGEVSPDGDGVATDDGGAATDGGHPPEAKLFYASVDERPDGIYTTTSRAFAVVGVADTIGEAEAVAEAALAAAPDEGVRVRHDVGTEALVNRRVEHAAELRGE